MIQHRDADGSYFDRVVVDWHEYITDADGETRQHTMGFAIDKENRMFLDCNKRLTYKKIFFSTLLRPLHTFTTIAHFIIEINAQWKQEQSLSRKLKETARAIEYIVAAPVFELALTIAGIASLILAPVVTPFDKSFIYRSRTMLGIIEKAMFAGVHAELVLAHCFQPFDAKDIVVNSGFEYDRKNDNYVLRNSSDTDYEGERPEVEESVNTFLKEVGTDLGGGQIDWKYVLPQEYDEEALKGDDLLKRKFVNRAFTNLARAHIIHTRNLGDCDLLRLFYSKPGPQEVYTSPYLK